MPKQSNTYSKNSGGVKKAKNTLPSGGPLSAIEILK